MDLEAKKPQYQAERYFLGEMTPREQEEFEQQMFESPELGADVRDLFILSENAASVLREEARARPAVHEMPQHKPKGWFRPSVIWPLAACVAFGAFAYQTLVSLPALQGELAGIRRPQVVVATVLRPATRGDDNIVAIGETQELVRLSFDVDTSRSYETVLCSVETSDGEQAFELEISPRDLANTLEISFPARLLKSGRYELVLSGTAAQGDKDVIERYRFAVRESIDGEKGGNR